MYGESETFGLRQDFRNLTGIGQPFVVLVGGGETARLDNYFKITLCITGTESRTFKKAYICIQFSSVQFSCSVVLDTL